MEMQRLKDQDLEKLAEQFVSEIGSETYSQFGKILSLLANGQPVAVAKVASELGITRGQAEKFLNEYSGEFDNNGNLVGLGLTQVPTPHHFEVDGHKLYTWCATDTLLFPVLLNKPAKVETSDPVTGTKIRLAVSPEGVESVEPSTAVLSYSNYLDAKDVRGTFCNVGHWFASRETGQEYASKHKGVTVLAPDEVRRVLRAVSEKTSAWADREELHSHSTPDQGHEGPVCA